MPAGHTAHDRGIKQDLEEERVPHSHGGTISSVAKQHATGRTGAYVEIRSEHLEHHARRTSRHAAARHHGNSYR